MTDTKRIIDNGQELFSVLVSYANSHSIKAIYPPCVLELADPVINNLLADGDMEYLKEGMSPLRQLAAAASRDISERAVGRPYSTALVDLATGLWDGEVGCPVVGLAGLLGFNEDGLAFQRISDRWYVVSRPRFEEVTGVAVRCSGWRFAFGLPVLAGLE